MKFSLEYTLNGRDVSAHEWERGLEAAMLENVSQQVEQELSSMRCLTHHQAPRLRVTGSAAHPKFEVTGCCKQLIDRPTQALQ